MKVVFYFFLSAIMLQHISIYSYAQAKNDAEHNLHIQGLYGQSGFHFQGNAPKMNALSYAVSLRFENEKKTSVSYAVSFDSKGGKRDSLSICLNYIGASTSFKYMPLPKLKIRGGIYYNITLSKSVTALNNGRWVNGIETFLPICDYGLRFSQSYEFLPDFSITMDEQYGLFNTAPTQYAIDSKQGKWVRNYCIRFGLSYCLK